MKTEILETAEAQTCITGMAMQTTWSGHLNIYCSPLLIILSVVFFFMHYNSADKSQQWHILLHWGTPTHRKFLCFSFSKLGSTDDQQINLVIVWIETK